MDMCSLGVVDLDLSISSDAFGLRAFDHEKPLIRMLPGSTPCELWLMLPLGSDGFHDIMIDNLATTPAWRSGHVLPVGYDSFSPLGLFPAMLGRRLFGPTFRVLLWTCASCMRPDVDWCTITGCIMIRFRTRRYGGGGGGASFLASCPV